MRLIVMYDFPMGTKAERKEYTDFRKFLLKDGFIMIQYSVYTRFTHNNEDAQKHTRRVIKNKPQDGDLRILKVTEHQYEEMILVLGEKVEEEKCIGSDSFIVID